MHIINELRNIINNAWNKKTLIILVEGLGGYPLIIPAKTKRSMSLFPSSSTVFLYSLHTNKLPHEHNVWGRYIRDGDSIKDVMEQSQLSKDYFQELSDQGLNVLYFGTKNSLNREEPVFRELKSLSQLYELPDLDLVFVHWDLIDWIGHRYGVGSQAYQQEIETLELTLKRLRKTLQDFDIYVVSDHGMAPSQEKIFLPEINGNVPVGGGRIAFYQVPYEEITKSLSHPGLLVLEPEELSLILGMEPTKEMKESYGETVVVAKKGYGFRFPYYDNRFLYDHGGLSKEERKIIIYKL